MLHIRMIKNFLALLIVCCIAGMVSCSEEDSELVGFSSDDVYSIASYIEENQEEYSNFWELIQVTDLYGTLNAYNPNGDRFSLFLPNNAAFDKYIGKTEKYASFDDLLNDTDFVNTLIRYHLVNGALESSDFPYGALSDSTALGDYLSIGIEITEDTSIFKVNNVAPLVAVDIETTNGFIHVISEVLEPITYSAYEWLNNNEGYSILSQLLEITEVSNIMGVSKYGGSGALIKNNYTLLVEHDSIFNKAGLNTIDDVIEKYHTPGLDYSNPDGGLYQMAAYHILDDQYFLDDLDGISNYNTFAVYPVSIRAGLNIQINNGIDTFKTVISGTDTTYIDYISIDLNNSNVNTKNGPVHFISDVLELFEPTRKTITYNFTNDPVISSLDYGTHYLSGPSGYEFIAWQGVETIKYYNPSVTTAESYMELSGDFYFDYTIPSVLPGEYEVYFRMNSNSSINAVIQVKIDGVRAGGNINLTTGSGAFTDILIGTINFTGNESHLLEINTLVPGRMRWSEVQLIPK